MSSFLSFLNHLDEQFLHLQIQPPAIITTTPTQISYPHPAPMINPHIPMGVYNHLPPPLLQGAYPIPNGTTYYQPSPQSTTTYQQPLTTPYLPHHPQILPGLPPHAPIAPQRTVNFITTTTTNNTHSYQQQQPSQRLSPTLIQTQELNIQALQQRMLEQQKHQQTPISIQRQINRLPTNDFTQYLTFHIFFFSSNKIFLFRYDIHRSTPNNGIPISVQSIHHPSMIVEQRLHGP